MTTPTGSTPKLYRHPSSDASADNYSASCIVLHGRCWIALFDDAGMIRRDAVVIDDMTRQVDLGRDPTEFFPELMFLRACLDWTPQTLIVKGPDGRDAGVAFVPPMSRPNEIARRREHLELFYSDAGL